MQAWKADPFQFWRHLETAPKWAGLSFSRSFRLAHLRGLLAFGLIQRASQGASVYHWIHGVRLGVTTEDDELATTPLKAGPSE